jgi:hypothetical protein
MLIVFSYITPYFSPFSVSVDISKCFRLKGPSIAKRPLILMPFPALIRKTVTGKSKVPKAAEKSLFNPIMPRDRGLSLQSPKTVLALQTWRIEQIKNIFVHILRIHEAMRVNRDLNWSERRGRRRETCGMRVGFLVFCVGSYKDEKRDKT